MWACLRGQRNDWEEGMGAGREASGTEDPVGELKCLVVAPLSDVGGLEGCI